MKKNLFTLLVLMVSWDLLAQDVILTNNDELIKAYNLEIGNNAVFYTLTEDADSPINKMNKSEIYIIKKADGTKIDFNKAQPQESETITQSNTPATPVLVMRPVDEKRRLEIIDQYSHGPKITYENSDNLKKSDWCRTLLRWAKSKKEKEFYVRLYYCWRPSMQSDVCNEDLEITYKNEHIILTNRSEKTMYVDLANTFLVNENGNATCCYKGEIKTTSSGSNQGVAFNLGGITNALGVGGIAGSLANATSIGKSNSSTSSTSVVEQRFISIPAGGNIEVPDTKIDLTAVVDSVDSLCAHQFHWQAQIIDIPERLTKGYSVVVTYSLSPDFSTYSILKSTLVPYQIALLFWTIWGDPSISADIWSRYAINVLAVKSTDLIVPDHLK